MSDIDVQIALLEAYYHQASKLCVGSQKSSRERKLDELSRAFNATRRFVENPSNDFQIEEMLVFPAAAVEPQPALRAAFVSNIADHYKDELMRRGLSQAQIQDAIAQGFLPSRSKSKLSDNLVVSLIRPRSIGGTNNPFNWCIIPESMMTLRNAFFDVQHRTDGSRFPEHIKKALVIVPKKDESGKYKVLPSISTM